MKSSFRLLIGPLFVVSAATSAFGGDMLGGSSAGDRVRQELPIMLAGANGHDTVGGLMPLPLWPSVATTPGAMPAKSWWKRRQRLCCGTMRQSERAQR
jgi:hypothetical protein